MKNILLSVLITILLNINLFIYSDPNWIKLENMRDQNTGFTLSGIIDVSQIVAMKKIQKTIDVMLYGHQVKGSTTRLGKYVINDKHYSIKELIDLENNLKNAPQPYTNEQRELHEQLQKVLESSKEEFIVFTTPFVDKIRHVKRLIGKIINEFCEKRDIKDCLMQKWMQTVDEKKEVRESVKTFAIYSKFITEVSFLLEAIMFNCPNARNEFEKLITRIPK